MHIGAKRVFRVSLTTALSLVAGYALARDIPFLAPVFGFLLTVAPKPPMGPKGLLGLLLVVSIMVGSGLLLIPVLQHYPATGLLLVLVGLFLANYVSLNLGKPPVGMFLVIGLTLVTMVGSLSYAVAVALVLELLIAIAIAVACQWLVYPLFPEDEGTVPEPPKPEPLQSSWLAARATLIVFPSYLLGLTNPTAYTPIIMKSVALGQQANETSAKGAGLELLGSTLYAALLAVLFWFGLKLMPNLWMFFLLTMAFCLFVVSRLYAVIPSRHPATYWQNVLITLFILVGPAVADSANGKDPYAASLVRFGLFVGVTLYAWSALVFLEWLKVRSERRKNAAQAGQRDDIALI